MYFLAWGKKGRGAGGTAEGSSTAISFEVLLKLRLKLVSSYSNLCPHALSVNEPKAVCVAGLIKSPKQPCIAYRLKKKRRPRERLLCSRIELAGKSFSPLKPTYFSKTVPLYLLVMVGEHL